MAERYKVVFRGDVAPGYVLADVRARLQELFKLDDQGIGRLFVGKPIAIKKNLDEATARKWCEALAKAGALADYVAEDVAEHAVAEDVAKRGDGSAQPAPAAAPVAAAPAETGWGIAPVGADVLTPAERAPVIDRDIPTPGLSVDAVGADVLREEERTPFHELQLDLSHIRLQDLTAE